MSTRRKRNVLLYAITLACSLTAISIVYSCSSDEYDANKMQMAENGTTEMCGLSSRILTSGNSLIDSIANSDEFWEFEMSTELFADKFHDYTLMLSEEEYDKLMENMNDDDYAEDFMKKAEMENELKRLAKARENLIQHTGFSRLSEDEKTQLFLLYAENKQLTEVPLLKTRQEGGNSNKCEEQKQAAYSQAKTDYNSALANCKKTSIACAELAAARYERNKRIADKEYADCINN